VVVILPVPEIVKMPRLRHPRDFYTSADCIIKDSTLPRTNPLPFRMNLLDVSTYKQGAIAGALYFILQTETATSLIESVVKTVMPSAARADADKKGRDTMYIGAAKAVLAVVAFKIINDMTSSNNGNAITDHEENPSLEE
jgi:hypothetical protein